MERIRRGEVWIVELLAHPKPRPAIVVSIDPINDLCPDVILIPITTKSGPLRIPLAENEPDTGLKQKSYAKCESIGPIHKSRLKKKIGEIPGNEWPMIENGIKLVLGLE